MVLALKIENVSKVYKDDVYALKSIDLEVNEGDFFALLGPNGAGKSTTISIISSLIRKTEGRVQVFGYDLDRELEQAKLCIGLVPQEFNFNMFETVEQIVVNQAGLYGVPYALAKERAQYYLELLELWPKRSSKARHLSGGMKRRLMIARALVHHPKLLILDEPTAGVDIELRRSMWDFLTKINEDGITIILTTHYLEEAETLCRNIGIIDQGRLTECTSMKSLLSKLHMETFVLDLKEKCHAIELKSCRSRCISDLELEIDVAKNSGLNQVFKELSEHGIEVLSMRNKVNRLESLFMQLVDNKEVGV
jgi:ABC-2 type transport system ATP-binding protein